jgi:outer membrane PBP1 activator LpoA protein
MAIATAVLLSACAAPPPLSDGRQRPATTTTAPPPVVRPAPPPVVPPPVVTQPLPPQPQVETRPLPPQPPVVAQPPAAPQAPAIVVPAPPVSPQPTGPIALVLPLDSATYGRAADAVRAGFVAAAKAAGVRYTIVAHGDDDALAAIAKARGGGASLIVGPLLRDDLRALALARIELPWTIALNALDDGTPLPPRVYTLALSIESDAPPLVRRARDDGAQTVAVVGSDSALQKRFAAAFIDEWIRQGGGPPTTLRFDRAPDMLALLRRELGRTHVDAVVLALDAPDAVLVKPYVGAIPTYTSSQVNDRQPAEFLRDLDDVRFVDIPWLADPESPVFADLPRPDYPNAALDRLYALGIDALAVAQAFEDGPPARLELEGATGHLWLEAGHRIQREGVLLQFREGSVVPLEAR